MKCRLCCSTQLSTFCDLGTTPQANAFLASNGPEAVEMLYPLHAFVCQECFLVQLPEVDTRETIFDNYPYFSSCTQSWLDHAQHYAGRITDRLSLSQESLVVEIASNDGYLLQFFRDLKVPVLGIEPAANVAAVASAKGIPTIVDFFGLGLAKSLREQGRNPDLVVANNVLAHVPDLHDFVAGIALLIGEKGTATLEFPHLLRLIEGREFDTIYHEHLSYFSLLTVSRLFAGHGLSIFDVEELATHGGSLRIYVRSCSVAGELHPSVEELIGREIASGLKNVSTYFRFDEQARHVKREFLRFLINSKDAGLSIAAYGAAAKANTLLNYCGIRTDFLDYVADVSEHKQGKYLPGTRIPIVAPAKVFDTKPDYLVILCWNWADEVMQQMSDIRQWGGKFVIPIPEVTIR